MFSVEIESSSVIKYCYALTELEKKEETCVSNFTYVGFELHAVTCLNVNVYIIYNKTSLILHLDTLHTVGLCAELFEVEIEKAEISGHDFLYDYRLLCLGLQNYFKNVGFSVRSQS